MILHLPHAFRGNGQTALCAAALLLVSVVTAFALGPHEVLVLVNSEASNSVRVAEEFIRLRDIPPANRVDLSLDWIEPGSLEIQADQYRNLIYEPAMAVARERGIASHILAWVYSTDFPVRTLTSPPISLTGMTFVRGGALPEEAIDRAGYRSPLFLGPEKAGQPGDSAQTLDVAAEALKDRMPLPAMMLGYVGKNGNTVEEVLACLRRGKQSDCTKPKGSVYFMTGSDIRAKCRQWQFSLAVDHLKPLGVDGVISSSLPTPDVDLLGIMAGQATIQLPKGVGFLPGAVADHLTSYGAAFGSPAQTKLSAWIRAGVTATSGTVSEPYSAWMKFPNAWFYVHYASGCTTLESFCLSIRSPLQILLVGDPLARPWGDSAELTVDGIPDGPASGVLRLTCSVASKGGKPYTGYRLLVDDRMVDQRYREPLILDTSRFNPGIHRLRIVAVQGGMVRGQVYLDRVLTIADPAAPDKAPAGMDDDTYEELKGILNAE